MSVFWENGVVISGMIAFRQTIVVLLAEYPIK